MNDFLSQTQLGLLFNVTSHKIGKWLVQCGLRTSSNKPSDRAFVQGIVTQAPTGRNDGYFYVWHREKTIAALQAAGHQLKAESLAPSEHPLSGPFEVIQANAGYELLGDKEKIGVLLMGERNAERIAAVLNVAFRHGVFK